MSTDPGILLAVPLEISCQRILFGALAWIYVPYYSVVACFIDATEGKCTTQKLFDSAPR
jgi:hypothetical protein